MKTAIIALIAIVLWSAAARAETVRLKNGRTITGTVLYDDNDPSGIRIQRWDTGGVITLKWSQIIPADRERLSKKNTTQVLQEDMVDVMRIITSVNVYHGIVVKEDDVNVYVKTRDGQKIIPRSSIEKREPIKIRMDELYTPQERVEQKAKLCRENDPACLMEVARFARALKLYPEAAAYYEQVAELAPDRTDEVAAQIGEMKIERTQAEARELYEAVLHNMQTHQYDDADKLARKLLAEYAATEIAQAHQDLPDRIAAAKEDFIKNRDARLSKELPGEWRSLRNSLLRKSAADSKSSLKTIMSYVSKQVDQEIIKQLVAKYAITQEDVLRFWDQREQTKKTAKYAAGSWIVTGGVSGQKLETPEEWWKSVSSGVRTEWLEALYAESSSFVKIVEVKKDIKCSQCDGVGTFDTVQQGRTVKTACPRCHGARYDLSVTYY